jgi:hypothetical protein
MLAAALAACAPTVMDFQAPDGSVSQQQRDFAECRIKATDVLSEFGGLAAVAAYNQTLKDCMTAKGYLKAQ